MKEILFYPLFVIPALYVFKLLRYNEAMTVWLAFLFSSLTFALTEHSLASGMVLVLAAVVLYPSFSGKLKFKSTVKSKNKYIVIGCNDELGHLYLSDGLTVIRKSIDTVTSFKAGDIVKTD